MEIIVSTMIEKNAMARASAISVIAFPLPLLSTLHPPQFPTRHSAYAFTLGYERI
jgi:hypothetical protein